MVPKVVQDAGYTAVGLGVLAIQQIQIRRRETRARLTAQLQAARGQLDGAFEQVRQRVEPLPAALLPRLTGPIGPLAEGGLDRLRSIVRREHREETAGTAGNPG